jgi:hypothetical protein
LAGREAAEVTRIAWTLATIAAGVVILAMVFLL